MVKVFRSYVFAVGLVLSLTGSALAQEVSLGCYLVPRIDGVMTTFMPKYINRRDMPDIALPGRGYQFLMLGQEPEYLVCANLTPAEHTFVSGQPDVFAFPSNFDATVGGNPNLNRVRNALEQRKVPSDQVTSQSTWRQVIRLYGNNGYIQLKLIGTHQTRLFPPGVSLDSQADETTFDLLMTTASQFNLSTAGITQAMIIRQILDALTAQMPPVMLMEEVF